MFKKKNTSGKEARQLIMQNDSTSAISEQYRNIRTNIQFSSVDFDVRSVLFTSSNPAEGKSTTVANVALTFAQQGKKTLLIDADLRKPVMHYTFGLQNTKGLTSILLKKNNISECIDKSNDKNLFILTSGPIPPNPSELLGSITMKETLDQLLEQFDMVLFDTPPTLAVTDAKVLANICDGIVLVVRSGKTEIEAAKKAMTFMKGNRARVLGAVLNDKEVNSKDYHYYNYSYK